MKYGIGKRKCIIGDTDAKPEHIDSTPRSAPSQDQYPYHPVIFHSHTQVSQELLHNTARVSVLSPHVCVCVHYFHV